MSPDQWRSSECISGVVIEDGITAIAHSSFKGCALTSITIPESVTNIGNDAFYGCGKLTDVYYYGIKR